MVVENVNQFMKVSEEQFIKDTKKNFPNLEDETIRQLYQSVRLPKRSSSGSAGYDFYLPFGVQLYKEHTVIVPTGIRCRINDGWMLAIVPRSGLGFKYRIQLDNTIGIIDSDYFNSDNEGHIMIKITNDTKNPYTWAELSTGDRFAQGIFMMYGTTVDDDCNEVRNGGFGSSGK
jgi:hypothetical protein